MTLQSGYCTRFYYNMTYTLLNIGVLGKITIKETTRFGGNAVRSTTFKNVIGATFLKTGT